MHRVLDDVQLSRAIIDSIQEPLVVLDEKLTIISTSNSFNKKFGFKPQEPDGQLFYNLGNGEWNIPALRVLLEEVIPHHTVVENYEVQHTFSSLGKRIMLVNAREIKYENKQKKMLISIFDITDQRRLEVDNEYLSQQKDILLKEMRHRIANSLQIIASILMIKAQTVTSEEAKAQLEDVHERIMSIATVQGHLDPGGLGKAINVPTYLSALCQSLAASMIGARRPLSIVVHADMGRVSSDEAIGLGLITTELVINALKHGFDYGQKGTVTVSYVVDGAHWTLSVQDNGKGIPREVLAHRTGLGAGIIDSLAKQLHATIETQSTPEGTKVSVIYHQAVN